MERRVRRMKTVAKEMREIIVRQLGGKMDKGEQLAQRSTDVLDTMLRTTVSLLRSGFLILSQSLRQAQRTSLLSLNRIEPVSWPILLKDSAFRAGNAARKPKLLLGNL